MKTSIENLITGESPKFQPSKLEIRRVKDRHSISHTEASPKSICKSFGFKKQDRVMRPCIVTMSHEFPPKPMMHGGQEFVFALEGIHEFYYDGQIYKIHPGDTLYFDSDCPHMGRSLSEKPFKILVIYCNPFNIRS
ncbi:MAG: cupin domain-containing protein [Desulfobacteraceae bacterium]